MLSRFHTSWKAGRLVGACTVHRLRPQPHCYGHPLPFASAVPGAGSNTTEWHLISGCRSRSAKLSGNLRNPSVKSACFVGQWAQDCPYVTHTHHQSSGKCTHLKGFHFSIFPCWTCQRNFAASPYTFAKNAWLNLSQMDFPHVWALIKERKQRGVGVGGDYYLEMCLWKHLCVQTCSRFVLRVRFSVHVPALLWLRVDACSCAGGPPWGTTAHAPAAREDAPLVHMVQTNLK